MDFIKKYKAYIILNLFLIIIYAVVFSQTKYSLTEASFFFAPDSQEYLSTSGEFYDFSGQGYSLTRPFLYPLILLLFYKTGGVFLIWFFQLLCWMGSINLLFSCIRRAVQNNILSWVATGIIAINLTFIVLTMLGLTEVFSIFLISLLMYNLFFNDIGKKSTSYKTLFILGLLTVTRPVFFYIFILYLIYHLFRFVVSQKKYLLNIFYTIVLILPVIYQLSVMKIKYDKLKISDIDTITLNDYLIARSLQASDSTLTRDESVYLAREIKNKGEYIFANFSLIIRLMITNMNDSLNGYPIFFYTPQYEHKTFAEFMEVTNYLYYWLHIIFILPLLAFLYLQWKEKTEHWLIYLFLFFICCYVLLTTGISFMQGDRLIITLLPLWLFLYSSTLNYYIRKISKRT